MLIMHISQICSLISVFKNKIYATLIDKTLYECVLLITNFFSNILIFLQHLFMSYITRLNTGTLVIKKYAHSGKCAHVCTNTHTHTQSSHYTIIHHFHFHTRTPFFLLHLTLITQVTLNRTRTLSITSIDSTLTSGSTYCSVTDMSTFLKDFYIRPIHVMKAQTISRGKPLLSLNPTLDGGVSCHHAPITLPRERTLMPIKGEAALTPEPVWTCLEVTKAHLTGIQPLVSTDHILVASQTDTLAPHSFLFFHKSSLAYIISVPIPFHIPSLTSIPQFTIRIMHTLKNHPGKMCPEYSSTNLTIFL